VHELKQRGFTILLVEQNLRFATELADRHYVMETGRVVDMLTRDDMISTATKPACKPTSELTMLEAPGLPRPLVGQLLLGLINGSFYAMMSLGLAIIFGLLNVVNFTHGAQYMMGAFVAWMLLQWLGIGYGYALVLAPLIVGVSGILLERLFVRRLYHLDHVYGLLLTFGLTLIVEGLPQGLRFCRPALCEPDARAAFAPPWASCRTTGSGRCSLRSWCAWPRGT
jgi:hypothetical protein